MPLEAVAKLLREAQKLSDEEQLELTMKLLERFRSKMVRPKYRSWFELAGMAPYPLLCENAREWISRTRQEGNERRTKQEVSLI